MKTAPVDMRQRPLRDIRISVTDRCNFRCTYCMPKEVFGRDFHFLPAHELLSFEEITRATGILVALGVKKARITGGEPLLRREIEKLVRMLAGVDGLEDLTLTTNGALLSEKAAMLGEAGLNRVTVSLDSLDDVVFKKMNDVDFPVGRVLEGIEEARRVGLGPIKVNCVVRRGVNSDSIIELARYFHGSDVVVRFIEYMDVGNTNGWKMDDVVPAGEIIAMIDRDQPLEPVDQAYRGEVATRYRYRDGGGEVGVIASVTQPFCGDCTRLRLSSEGRLYTCLFGSVGHDLRAVLRSGVGDETVSRFLEKTWTSRDDRYSEIRTSQTSSQPKVEMSRIGG